MPIRPENLARYPKDWPEISKRIRFERAGGRCECEGHCGLDHRSDPLNAAFDPGDERCAEMHGDRHSVTGSWVVLTTAHLDHTPENCSDDNLKAMCQRCHNRYDLPYRRANAERRARAGRACGDLFDAAEAAGETRQA